VVLLVLVDSSTLKRATRPASGLVLVLLRLLLVKFSSTLPVPVALQVASGSEYYCTGSAATAWQAVVLVLEE
jgi:hypothetical protein